MSAPTVIVTGSGGWLGRRLVKLLASGQYEPLIGPIAAIRGLDQSLPDMPEGVSAAGIRVSLHAGDIRRREAARALFAGTEGAIVIHTAGIIHPNRIRDLYEVNVDGTGHILAAAAEHRASRVVLVSSNSPIGCNAHESDVFGEDAPYNPYMNYGRSKMQMELMARERAARDGLALTIVRPPWFYGPDQPPRQTLFFRLIRTAKMPLLGSGTNRRSMAYVDNLVQGLALAASRPAAIGKTYWIADRAPYSMNEIIDTVERLLETEFNLPVTHRRMRLPGFVGDAARVADAMIQATGFYSPKIHVLSEMNRTIACSIDAAVADLGYAPSIGLEEGMRRSIRWCLDSGAQI